MSVLIINYGTNVCFFFSEVNLGFFSWILYNTCFHKKYKILFIKINIIFYRYYSSIYLGNKHLFFYVIFIPTKLILIFIFSKIIEFFFFIIIPYDVYYFAFSGVNRCHKISIYCNL